MLAGEASSPRDRVAISRKRGAAPTPGGVTMRSASSSILSNSPVGCRRIDSVPEGISPALETTFSLLSWAESWFSVIPRAAILLREISTLICWVRAPPMATLPTPGTRTNSRRSCSAYRTSSGLLNSSPEMAKKKPNTSPKSSFTNGVTTPGGNCRAASPTRRRSSSQICGSAFEW